MYSVIFQHVRSHNDHAALSHTFSDVINSTSRATRELRRRCLNPGLYAQHLQRWLDYFDISQARLYVVSLFFRFMHFFLVTWLILSVL